MTAAASAVLRKGRSVDRVPRPGDASAVTSAMAAAYAALGGIELLDFVTAGDRRYVAICQDCADSGPYTPANYPGVAASPLPVRPAAAWRSLAPVRRVRRLHDQESRLSGPAPSKEPS